MIGTTSVVPSATQEPHQEQEATITEATTTTATAPADGVQGRTLTFDEQMMRELLGHHSDPFADLSFVMGGVAPVSSSSDPAASASGDAHTTHEEKIIAEINVEMEAAARASSFGGEMAGPSPAPLRMFSPEGTVVDTNVPHPPANIDPIPPTPAPRNIPIHLSSERKLT